MRFELTNSILITSLFAFYFIFLIRNCYTFLDFFEKRWSDIETKTRMDALLCLCILLLSAIICYRLGV